MKIAKSFSFDGVQNESAAFTQLAFPSERKSFLKNCFLIQNTVGLQKELPTEFFMSLWALQSFDPGILGSSNQASLGIRSSEGDK